MNFDYNLAPMLREKALDDDPIDLSSVQLSHYRLSKIKQQDLLMVKEAAAGLYAGSEIGTGKPRNKAEEWLSQIIARLNDLFITDGLSSKELQAGFQRVVFDILLRKAIAGPADLPK